MKSRASISVQFKRKIVLRPEHCAQTRKIDLIAAEVEISEDILQYIVLKSSAHKQINNTESSLFSSAMHRALLLLYNSLI